VIVNDRLGADRSLYVETDVGLLAARVGAERGVPAGALVTLAAHPSSVLFFAADGASLG
jgi:hypothetical protein